MWFEAIFELSINLDKSKLIPIERVENLEELALEFGCKVGAFPSSYMGFPLGASFTFVVAWDKVEKRFRKKLVYVEKVVYFQRWEAYTKSEHSFYYTHLFHVLVLHSKDSQVEVRIDSKEFSLGRAGLRAETSFDKVGHFLWG